MIVDYYAVLSRAVASLEHNTVEMRRAVYDRARQMLADRLAQVSLPPSEAELRAEATAFDDAVARIEAEIAQARIVAAPPQEPIAPGAQHGPPDDTAAPAPAALPRPRRLGLLSGLAVALVIGIFALGYFAAFTGLFTPKSKAPAKNVAASPQRTASAPNALTEDPDPGFEGGASFSGLPFFYRRQPVYYRTTHPASTIVIDKSQYFLYLVQSNTVALRYGIAMGRECRAAHGLHLVARKEEWPVWQPSEIVLNVRAVPANLAGGPGNPLGARLLNLNTDANRVHGTNAPSTIGREMLFGCVRLANDDIVDLCKRVPVGARVIITN